MDQTPDTQQLLQIIAENQQQQIKLQKRQLFALRCLLAVCILSILLVAAAGMTLLPRAQLIVADLQTVASQLAQVDWQGMANNINAMAENGTQSITQAAEKFNQLDLESLNATIQDLARIVERFAGLFGLN